jgi:oligopeptide/dipeptide ABC transporter ATP-binding protein
VTGAPVVEVRDLVKEFPVRAGFPRRRVATVHAVSGVSFAIGAGETLALVGESGCGKSTTARVVLGLVPATSGSVRYRDVDVTAANAKAARRLRAKIQLVFQDPYASLDPRMTARASVEEPMHVHDTHRDRRGARADELLALVELDRATGDRYPHELSGGQRQRVGIARALALDPDVVVLDEPVSALDASVRAGVLNLLDDLQERLSLTYLFVAHDLAVVRHVADAVAVMYLGKIVETGPAETVYVHAAHPYTQALLSAVPVPDPRVERGRTRIVLEGDVPSPTDPPSGCRFRTRCWKAQEVCAREEPALVDRGQAHPVACHFAEEMTR